VFLAKNKLKELHSVALKNQSGSYIAVNGGTALRFYQKDLDLCFKDEQMSYRFGRHEGEYLMTSFLG